MVSILVKITMAAVEGNISLGRGYRDTNVHITLKNLTDCVDALTYITHNALNSPDRKANPAIGHASLIQNVNYSWKLVSQDG